MRRIAGRPLLTVFALALVLVACEPDTSGDTTEATIRSAVEAEQTTTTLAPAATTTTSSTTTTTTIPAGPPIASEGDNNETVEAAQFLLNCSGFGDLTQDGAFGPATKEAVEAAQSSLGFQVNGILDDLTFAALARDCSLSRRIADDGEEIVTMVGNTSPDDPETYLISLVENSELVINVTSGLGVNITVLGAGDVEVPVEGQGTFTIEESGEYRIVVITEAVEGVTFSIAVDLTVGEATTGDWVLATDGFSYKGTKLALGDDAQTVIDKVFEFLGHGIRGAYEEFDTDWYTIDDPQSLGLRGVFIEGFAMLFFGPHPGEPDRAETFERLRFEGPSDDADGDPRSEDYVTTATGITVGDTLADLKAAYEGDVSSGSNSDEHYYRYTDSGGELCFYFGSSAPDDDDTISEIATECRS